MGFPYLDFNGFLKRCSVMPDSSVQLVATLKPGFIEARIKAHSSWIDARLRKRYGNRANIANSLPLGQRPPTLIAAGTTAPAVAMVGRPVLGSLEMLVQITTLGALGTAAGKWSPDDGVTWTQFVSGASVSMPGTGMSLVMPAATYAVDNVYAADTPVPEIVLGWLVTLVTWDCFDKRGKDSTDPTLSALAAACDRVRDDVKEAADSDVGLFDIPTSEDQDSAITTGGPRACSQAGPYEWTDVQAASVGSGRPW